MRKSEAISPPTPQETNLDVEFLTAHSNFGERANRRLVVPPNGRDNATHVLPHIQPHYRCDDAWCQSLPARHPRSQVHDGHFVRANGPYVTHVILRRPRDMCHAYRHAIAHNSKALKPGLRVRRAFDDSRCAALAELLGQSRVEFAKFVSWREPQWGCRLPATIQLIR